jgi:transposase
VGGSPRQDPLLARPVPAYQAPAGAKKTILAVAISMLTAAYHMLRDGVEYADLGADYFSHHDTGKTIQRLLKRLADLGCQIKTVTLPENVS